MKIYVCDQTYDITESTSVIDGEQIVEFSAIIDGKPHKFKTSCEQAYIDKSVVLADTNLNMLQLEDEIKLELYALIRGVTVTDVAHGKYPELIEDFIANIGIFSLEAEVVESYINGFGRSKP